MRRTLTALMAIAALVGGGWFATSLAASPPEPAAGHTREAPELPAPTDAAAKECQEPDEAERRLLGALRQRRRALEQRERLVALREAELAKIEARLLARAEASVARLAELEERLGTKRHLSDRTRSQRIDALVETIHTLSPRRAAPILATTDPELCIMLLARLGPERSGELLGRMDPAHAALLLKLAAGPSRPRVEPSTAGAETQSPPRRPRPRRGRKKPEAR